MDLQPTANPVGAGSGVNDAATEIERLNLLDSPEEQPEEQEHDAQATREEPGAETTDAETPEGESTEAQQADKTESPESESDTETLELPETLDALAEALGLEADGLYDRKVNVKVNGETKAVTLAEAVKGYQMEADYRHKTAALAEERRAFDAGVQQAVQEWQKRLSTLDPYIEQLSQVIAGEEKSLDDVLINQGSEAYLAAKRQIEERKQTLDAAKAEKEKAEAEMQEQQNGQYQQFMARERQALVEAIPEMADPDKAAKLKDRMTNYLLGEGATKEHMREIVTALQVKVIRKAMLYDELQKAKGVTAKKLKGLPKVTKPGAAPDKGDQKRTRRDAKLQRLRKTGSARDAASIFGDIL